MDVNELIKTLESQGKNTLANVIAKSGNLTIDQYSKYLWDYDTQIPLEPALIQAFQMEFKRLGIDEYNTPHELREVIFDIIKPSGKRASLQVDILRDKIKEEEFIILKNKAKYIKDIILSDYYIDEFSEIGLYTISATYENTTKSHGTSVEAWIGKIKSNIIAVVIKK